MAVSPPTNHRIRLDQVHPVRVDPRLQVALKAGSSARGGRSFFVRPVAVASREESVSRHPHRRPVDARQAGNQLAGTSRV